MPGFLCNFYSLNAVSLCKAARLCYANNIASFLERRRDQVRITEEVIKAAAQNIESGNEIIALLLQQREEVEIIEGIVKAAAENTQSGEKVIALLLQQ